MYPCFFFFFTWMIGCLILCVGRMILKVFSPFIVFGILSVHYRTKWSGESLYDINMLSCDSLSSYGLLFTRHFRLGISSCPTVPFRLTSAFYTGVVGKILMIYFFTACSFIAFGMIFVLNASFFFGADPGLVPFYGSFFWVEVVLLNR
jgi:hypothetical protein